MTLEMACTLIIYAVLAIALTYVVTKDIPNEPPGGGPDKDDQ